MSLSLGLSFFFLSRRFCRRFARNFSFLTFFAELRAALSANVIFVGDEIPGDTDVGDNLGNKVGDEVPDEVFNESFMPFVVSKEKLELGG